MKSGKDTKNKVVDDLEMNAAAIARKEWTTAGFDS